MTDRETVGVVIAAGYATRLALAEGSKELLPVANLPDLSGIADGPRCPVVRYLLNAYREAGVHQVCTVYRHDKSDFPAGIDEELHRLGLSGTAIATAPTRGPVDTLSLALGQFPESRVAFGFPDIIAQPSTIVRELLATLDAGDADVAMALVPATRPAKVDLVAVDAEGYVRDIVIKDAHCRLPDTWSHLVWTPRFSAFLCDWNRASQTADGEQHGKQQGKQNDEQHVAHALLAGIAAGFRIRTRRFEHGRVLDIGTPDDLAIAQSGRCREELLGVDRSTG